MGKNYVLWLMLQHRENTWPRKSKFRPKRKNLAKSKKKKSLKSQKLMRKSSLRTSFPAYRLINKQ